MSNKVIDESSDLLINNLKESKNSRAVLKLELITFRSSNPDAIVFAFEGVDDKIVYSHWIKQCAPLFVYEPFPCQNKIGVLQLKESLERDLMGLSKNVYYFIDRDFDDLAGHTKTDKLFMTDKYSIENYLVTREVLEELLKNEFHCHAKPQCRATTIDLFEKQYVSFLEKTVQINLRIYIAKKCRIARKKDISSKINSLAKVFLKSIQTSESPIDEVVSLTREPLEDEIEKYSIDFKKLKPADRYRGKFALAFLRRWLEHLAVERNTEPSLLFPNLDRENFKAPGYITLDSLASKAKPPEGFAEFLKSI